MIYMKWRCDHRNCNFNLARKKHLRASTGFEPMASALALQWSTNSRLIPVTGKASSTCAHLRLLAVPFGQVLKMNSINWSAPNIWVFIAQLVEHCSANAEAMGLNPVEALKTFFRAKIFYLL